MNKILVMALAFSVIATTACANQSNPTLPIPSNTGTVQQSLPGAAQQAQSAASGAFPSESQPPVNANTLLFPGPVAGDAFAAEVKAAGGAITVGPIAFATVGCGQNPGSVENSAASINSPPLILSGTAKSQITTTRTTTDAAIASMDVVQSASLLGGLITASVIKAQTNTIATSGGTTSNETGSQFFNLTVAGVKLPANVAPNTKINLLGLGYVVLNEFIVKNNGAWAGLNMIDIHITTANLLHIPVGTRIVVAQAHTAFTPSPSPFGVGAAAYSLYATGVLLGTSTVTSGPWALAAVGCLPGSTTQSLISATTPIGTLGTMTNHAFTTNTATTSTAEGDSSTQNIKLLSGLVGATAVTSQTKVARTGLTFTSSGASTFVGLTIAGKTIAASVPPNTKINLLGIGYVVLNFQAAVPTATSLSRKTIAIEVVVTTANPLKLPVGLRAYIGATSAEINGY